jgi:hypothetical protein
MLPNSNIAYRFNKIAYRLWGDIETSPGEGHVIDPRSPEQRWMSATKCLMRNRRGNME